MPRKRPYKKSTLGCRTCKRRRVKCDEVRPSCGQCSKHGVVCDFADTSTSSSPQSDVQPSLLGPLSQPTVVHPSYDDTTCSRMLELRLMHHVNSLSWRMSNLGQDTRRLEVWNDYVPSLAFQGGPLNPLLDLLLANSALDLHFSDPTDTSLKLASSQKFALALGKMKALTLQINEQNTPILFAGSILLSLGSGSIAAQTRDWIHNSGFKQLFFDEPNLIDTPKSFVGWTMAEDSPFQELLLGLDHEPLGSEHVATYKIAVTYLSWTYTSHVSGEDPNVFRRKVLGFPGVVPTALVELLEAHDPRTLVITAHFFGVTTLLNELWWFQGVAEREISGLLKLIPPEWEWAMSWPLQQLRGTTSHTPSSSYLVTPSSSRSDIPTLLPGSLADLKL